MRTGVTEATRLGTRSDLMLTKRPLSCQLLVSNLGFTMLNLRLMEHIPRHIDNFCRVCNPQMLFPGHPTLSS